MFKLSQNGKNSFLYLSQTFISTLLPLIVLLVTTRYAPPEAFSDYAISLVYSVVVTGVFSLGLHLAYERDYYLYRDNIIESHSYLFSILLLVFFVFTICVFFTVFFVSDVSFLLGGVSHEILIVIFVGMCFEKLAGFYLIYYKNSLQAIRYFYVMVSMSISSFLLSVYFIAFDGLGVHGLCLAYMLSWGLVFIVVSVLSWIRSAGFTILYRCFIPTLAVSLPIVPRSMTVVIGTQSDKYMLNNLSPEHLGHYALAGRISTVLNSYMIALQNIYNPKLYDVLFNRTDGKIDEFNNILVGITFLSLFPAIFLSLFSFEIVLMLFPQEYKFLSLLLSVFSVYYGCIFFGKIPGTVLTYAKKTGLASLIAIMGAILNISLNFVLIRSFGALGAAFSTLITGVVVTALGMYLAQINIKIGWDFRFVSISLAILFASASFSFFSYFFQSYFLFILLAKFLFLIVVLLFFWFEGVFDFLRNFLSIR